MNMMMAFLESLPNLSSSMCTAVHFVQQTDMMAGCVWIEYVLVRKQKVEVRMHRGQNAHTGHKWKTENKAVKVYNQECCSYKATNHMETSSTITIHVHLSINGRKYMVWCVNKTTHSRMAFATISAA